MEHQEAIELLYARSMEIQAIYASLAVELASAGVRPSDLPGGICQGLQVAMGANGHLTGAVGAELGRPLKEILQPMRAAKSAIRALKEGG